MTKTALEAMNKLKEKVHDLKQENSETPEEIFGAAANQPAEIVPAIKAEGHAEMVLVQKGVNIVGLEEVPASIVPLPFYKMVQPMSTKVTLAAGGEAQTGTFFMGDSGQSVSSLRFALLRAKRQLRDYTDKDGNSVRKTTMGLLGIKLEGFNPFIMSLAVTSFSGFGKLIKQLKDKKAKYAWEYPIMATAVKVETQKEIDGRLQTVKYWVVNFQVEEEPLDEAGQAILRGAYEEYAASLDRQQEQQEKAAEPMPFN
ncbi:hypothetical protein HZB78_05450 [Candidatus Collierbacteria bacterium]|nr:hypothetical protein [Candidatus Collierbacteria bacterium]